MKPKQHLEFVSVDLNNGWEVPPGYPSGFYQKVLASDLDEKAKRAAARAFSRSSPALSPPRPSCTITGKRSI